MVKPVDLNELAPSFCRHILMKLPRTRAASVPAKSWTIKIGLMLFYLVNNLPLTMIHICNK